MTVTDIAARHQRNGLRIKKAALREVRRWWRRLDPRNLDGSWLTVEPQIIAAVVLAQRRAAEEADPYLSAVLAEQDIDVESVGKLAVEAFTGVASDGRELKSLLYEPVIATKVAIGRGRTATRALRTGHASLQLITSTQVADAGRTADGVALAARPGVGGYVRMLTLPSCERCVVLAGKFYRWNNGFLRHPQCDCRHIPSSEGRGDDLRTDPKAAIASGQIRGLSKADTKAIVEDGADPAQVINARRGMRTAGGRKLTTEGTTRRGLAGQRLGARRGQRVQRLRPEAIYREANGNRSEAIRLLRLHGYIL